jgi:hypothetical protein
MRPNDSFLLSSSHPAPVFVNLIAAIPMSSDYDSDESTGSATFQPSATIPAPPVSNDPTFKLGRNGTRFLIVDHTANQRHGSKISDIWFHGGERRRCDDGSMDRYCKSFDPGGSLLRRTSLLSISTHWILSPAQQCLLNARGLSVALKSF